VPGTVYCCWPGVTSAYDNPPVITNGPLNEYVSAICELFYDDYFLDYQFDLMRPFTREILNNPLLFDNTYMFFTNDFDAKDVSC
jgi:hypothetical protein